MTDVIDIDEYLKRINYTGSREPTLETLKSLCRAHVTSVSYSNYGFFGGPRCKMEIEYMYNTVVKRKQGDICYVLNGLFGMLLRKLRFDVKFGHGCFWDGKKYTVPYHHLTPLVIIDGKKWFYDVGWLLYEPVKFELMKPQVQRHGIFRFRKNEEKENWIVFERYRKTVLDKDGKVLKQGPALPGGWDGPLDCDQMKVIDYKLWSPVFTFTNEVDLPMSRFSEMTNYFQDNKNTLMHWQLLHHRFTETGMYRMYAHTFAVKEHVDPLTDRIVEFQKVDNDEVAGELTDKFSEHKLDFKLKFFAEGHNIL